MNVQEFNRCFNLLAKNNWIKNEPGNKLSNESLVLIHTEAGALFNVHGMRYDKTKDAWIIVGAPV